MLSISVYICIYFYRILIGGLSNLFVPDPENSRGESRYGHTTCRDRETRRRFILLRSIRVCLYCRSTGSPTRRPPKLPRFVLERTAVNTSRGFRPSAPRLPGSFALFSVLRRYTCGGYVQNAAGNGRENNSESAGQLLRTERPARSDDAITGSLSAPANCDLGISC